MPKAKRRGFRQSLSAGAVVLFVALGPTRAAARPSSRAERSRQDPSAEDSARAIHLLQRTTFGPRPADIAEVLRLGPSTWLDRQLHPESLPDDDVQRRLASFPAASMSVAELARQYAPAGARPARDSASSPRQMTPEMRRERTQRSPARLLGELVNGKLQRAVYSDRQLEEVMTDFWFNHFNVFFAKGLDRYLVSDYERNAIRPHVFGRFEDLLAATARHPAMLFYLDNWTSTAADSLRPGGIAAAEQRKRRLERLASLTDAQKERLVRSGRVTRQQLERVEQAAATGVAGRDRGINENYARELMELHTLGVDGGYTQRDVVNVARAFTGWTFRPPARRQAATRSQRQAMDPSPDAFGFLFRPEMHDTASKMVLGHTLPAGRGIEDGEDVIRILARHPATARFIASELVQYFVTDDPAPAYVDRLAKVFLDTDGDLREVTRALFTDDAFYDPRYRGAKVKTPFQLVASALRMTGAEAGPSRKLVQMLRSLGQLPYTEQAPTGFPASSEDWVNSGAMINRMNLGLALAANRIDGVRITPARLLPGIRADGADPRAVADRLMPVLVPGVPTDHLRAAIEADLRDMGDGQGAQATRARAVRAFGLILGSPEFQRH